MVYDTAGDQAKQGGFFGLPDSYCTAQSLAQSGCPADMC